jgi:hypothetical protein
VLKRWQRASRLAQWFALSPVVVAVCLGAGFGTGWSANGLAFVVAVGLAYIAVPSTVLALISWQQQRGAGGVMASSNANRGGPNRPDSLPNSDSGVAISAKAAAPDRTALARPEWSPGLTELLRVISEHLDSEEDLEAVRMQANVSRRRLRTGRVSENAWQFLLDRAMDERLLDDVLAAAADKSPDVAAAVDKYHRGQ